ncbi:hypothetical protein HDU84_002361 [Entophlyctis sp. JEL0112]|nr:hypothetical protein HDU84_002361 [Entophlyctis sp. JEL0112]
MDPKFLAIYTPKPVCLGNGGFGFVTSAVRNSDGAEVAVKFILREKVPPKSWARDPVLGVIPVEVDHKNIIKFLDYFSDNIYLYLVTELHGATWTPAVPSISATCSQSNEDYLLKSMSPSLSDASTLGSGRSVCESPTASVCENKENLTLLERRNSCDLFECIEFFQRFNENQARKVFKQIVSAVSYLASMNIIHRDIKDENVLIDSEFNVKLIDFGSATILNKNGDVSDGLFLGTLQYAAPEILTGSPCRGSACEVWALGCCLYIMLAGETPFESPRDIVMLPAPLAPRKAVLSSNVCGLIRWMLEKDPARRATLPEILMHPWMILEEN